MSNFIKSTDNIITLPGATTIVQGGLQVNGLMIAKQTSDPIFQFLGSSPILSMTDSMVYYFLSPNAATTTLTIYGIPSTLKSTYVFTLIYNTPNSPYYFTGTTLGLVTTGAVSYNATVYAGAVTLPTTYTYIVQSITIVNTGSTNNFIALSSVQAF